MQSLYSNKNELQLNSNQAIELLSEDEKEKYSEMETMISDSEKSIEELLTLVEKRKYIESQLSEIDSHNMDELSDDMYTQIKLKIQELKLTLLQLELKELEADNFENIISRAKVIQTLILKKAEDRNESS